MADANDTTIDRAIEYIRTLQPAVLEGIRPCTETELADLEILARTRFSGIHRAFLRRFGNSVGGLDFGPVDPTAPALREVFEATTGSLPPGYELFAVSREDPYLDVFLVGQEPDELQIGTSYSVFGGDFGDLDVAGLTVVSGSLTELLCYIPYVHTRYEPKPMKFMLSNRQPVPGAMQKFNQVVADNGMNLIWFSTAMTRVVEFGETVLLAKQTVGAPLAVSVASSNKTEFAAVHWWLTRNVGLEAGV